LAGQQAREARPALEEEQKKLSRIADGCLCPRWAMGGPEASMIGFPPNDSKHLIESQLGTFPEKLRI
jgi:hypothetical protein